MSVIFVIGVFNLMLGFAMAVLMERRIVLPYPAWNRERDPQEVEIDIPLVESVPAEDPLERLPSRWIEILEASDGPFDTLVAATVEVLKLEVNEYREKMLEMEDSLRSAFNDKNDDAVGSGIRALVAFNEEWIEQQHDALRIMEENRDQLGEYLSQAGGLEALMLDQVTLIKSECNTLENLDSHDPIAWKDSVYSGVERLISLAHKLRDEIRIATLRVIIQENRLETVTRKQQQDQMTGLQNRIGLETIFRNWWREDPERHRLLSVALIDLDRFGALNHQLSTRVGDRVLRAVANYIQQLVTGERGLERVIRLESDQLFVFFGDSGPRTATGQIEKVRQTIQETRLDYSGVQYSLTIRAGITNVWADDDLESLLERLQKVTESTRHAGRNCTALCDASGTGIVQAEKLNIRRRVNRVQ